MVVLAVLAAGCHRHAGSPSRRSGDELGAWPEAPAEGFAVVPWGARIYVEPRVGAPSVRLGWSVAEPPPWPSGGTVVRVLGHRDGFVEIASVVHGEVAHCEAVLDADALDVRL
ncbi:MAG: hypothetical protein KDA21_03390, partial [Phycisphaerales bacterium]|nr:hypothetical protein [Phycisphaerales bacterium]